MENYNFEMIENFEYIIYFVIDDFNITFKKFLFCLRNIFLI